MIALAVILLPLWFLHAAGEPPCERAPALRADRDRCAALGYLPDGSKVPGHVQ